MPIQTEDGFLVTHDLAHVASVGIESKRLDACVDRIVRDRVKGVFGSSCFGFTGDNLDFLSRIEWVEAVWFWDVKLASVEGLYALSDLQFFGVHPSRPPIDFGRFPRLRKAVIEPRARDKGLATLSDLQTLHLWRCPPRNRSLEDYPLPDSVEELGLFWSSVGSLDDLPALPRLRKLEIAHCRNLESLGDLGSKFPRLEHLVVTACGRVRHGEGERVAQDLPHLAHAFVRDRKVI